MGRCLIRVRISGSWYRRKRCWYLRTGYGGSSPQPFVFQIGAGEVIKGYVSSMGIESGIQDYFLTKCK